MSLQFIAGCSGSGKTETIHRMLIERSRLFPKRNLVLIVPEQFNMTTLRDVVMKSPEQGIMNIDVLSFTRLCHRIFDEAGHSVGIILDDVGKSMVLRRIASRCSDRLGVMSRSLSREGYIEELKSLISELVQYDIGLSDIQSMIENNSGRKALSDKLSDIKLLYEEFLSYMGERYITAEEILYRAVGVADKAAFLSDAELYFDGYTGFTPVQLHFIEAMMGICRRVVVSVTLGDELLSAPDLSFHRRADETELFSLGVNTVYDITALAHKTRTGIEKPVVINSELPYRFRRFSQLAFIERNIFRNGQGSQAGRGFLTGIKKGEIRIVRAISMQEEADSVCRSIQLLVREKGCSYSDIAVLTGSLDKYRDIFLESAAKYHIPCFADNRHALRMNPLSELTEAFVEMTVRDYSYQSVFRFLRTSLAGFSKGEAEELENYVLAAGIRRKGDYLKPWDRLPRGYTPERVEELDALRERFALQVREVSAVFLPRKKTDASLLAEAFYSFMKKLGVYDRLSAMSEEFYDSGDVIRGDEFRQVYEKLIELLDCLVEFLGGEKITVREFGEILASGMAELSVGVLPPGKDEVIIGDIKRSRLCEVDHLFLAGVNDGLIPADERRGGILSEMDRQVLHDQGVRLAAGVREQAFIQRFYIYMYLTKAKESLNLSYSMLDEAGETLAPSYAIDEIRGLVSMLNAGGFNMRHNGVQTEIWGEDDTLCDQRGDSPEFLTRQEALSYLSANLKSADPVGHEKLRELYAYFASGDRYRETTDQILKHAFRRYEGDRISSAVAAALYGGKTAGSISRLESFAGCAFAHFLQYGLRLRQRQEFSFETRDLGSIFHEILRCYAMKLKSRGIRWEDVSYDTCLSLTRQALDEVLEGQRGGALHSSCRSAYMERRIRRIMEKNIPVITYQVQKGSFIPDRFEYAFYTEEVRGIIDRLDVYRNDSGVYLRIVDYKSSEHRFEPGKFYDGVSLQLPVYAQQAKERLGMENPASDVKVAGMLYYHIFDPVIDAADEGDTDTGPEIKKALRLKGLLVCDPGLISHMDPDIAEGSDILQARLKKDGSFDAYSEVASGEELNEILKYSKTITRRLCDEVLSGSAQARPYRWKKDEPTGCSYCRYSSICGFDEYVPGYEYREGHTEAREEIMEMIRSDNAAAAGTEPAAKAHGAEDRRPAAKAHGAEDRRPAAEGGDKEKTKEVGGAV